MLQKDNRYKVLGVFFENPRPSGIGFQLREVSRKVALAPKSVKIYLSRLEKEGLVLKKRYGKRGYPTYYANRDSERFRYLKRMDMIMRIGESGLLDHLDDACSPDAIVLFGSASRGEDIMDSDIDLFLLCAEGKVDLKGFEARLSRRISLFFSEDFGMLSPELKNNIINGVILKGYLKVF